MWCLNAGAVCANCLKDVRQVSLCPQRLLDIQHPKYIEWVGDSFEKQEPVRVHDMQWEEWKIKLLSSHLSPAAAPRTQSCHATIYMAGFPLHMNHWCALSQLNRSHHSFRIMFFFKKTHFNVNIITLQSTTLYEYACSYTYACRIAGEQETNNFGLVDIHHSKPVTGRNYCSCLTWRTVYRFLCHFLHVLCDKTWFGDQNILSGIPDQKGCSVWPRVTAQSCSMNIMIKMVEAGVWLGKADITEVFKVRPLHPSQWHGFANKLAFNVLFLS